MLKSEEWSFHSLWRVGAVGAPRRFIKSEVNQKILVTPQQTHPDLINSTHHYTDTVILLMEPQPSTECINEMKLDTSLLSNLPLNDLKKYSNN